MAQEAIIRCHCGQLTQKVRLRDEIPIPGLLCHCNPCRQTTGAITFSNIHLVDPPADVFTTKLVKYATAKIDRYFCGTCGSHACEYSYKNSQWAAGAGCVDEVIGGNQGMLERYTAHEFVGDTIDGGLAFMFPDIPMYLGHPTGEPITNLKDAIAKMQASATTDTAVVSQEDRVDARCHCGQVDFSILRPKDSTQKYTATLDACRSCRLSTGQPIIAWILHVPNDHIIWKQNNAIHNGSPHPSTTRYQSSDHAHRDFCSRCGASIFYATSTRPECVDVALGVVRARDGVLARSFVRWRTEGVEFVGDAVDGRMIAEVVRGLGGLEGE